MNIITAASPPISKTITNLWTSISWCSIILKYDEEYMCKKNIREKSFASICDYIAYINRHDSINIPNIIELTFDALPEPFSADNKVKEVGHLSPNIMFKVFPDKEQKILNKLF